MSQFAQNLKPGDIITAYHKGYHQVVKVERRFHTQSDIDRYGEEYGKVGDEYRALIYYKTVLTANYKLAKKSKIKDCDATYCTKITVAEMEKQRREVNQGIDRVVSIAKTANLEYRLKKVWRGVPNNVCCSIVTSLARGIDFSGCTKTQLLESVREGHRVEWEKAVLILDECRKQKVKDNFDASFIIKDFK